MSVQSVESMTSAQSQTPLFGSERILDKDDFLKMLIAQLTHQNPLDPITDTEFVAQLAEFSALEQMQNVNTNLQAITMLAQSLNNSLAVGLIGKSLKATGNTIFLTEAPTIDISYYLSANANVRVKISDSNGQLVKTIEAGSQSAGDNTISWDGGDDAGEKLPEGTYTFQIEAKDSNGNNISTVSYIVGKVTGLKFDNGVAVLLLGEMELRLSDILEIYENA